MKCSELRLQLAGYSLTTAEILYRLPDYPSLLQSYVWQEYDLVPSFPRLRGFLEFWRGNLEGSLYRVRVAHERLLGSKDIRLLSDDFKLN